MKVTLKLFATLADYLPAGARGNVAELELAAAPTVAGLIESFSLPPRLVHLVLVNGNFIAPDARSGAQLKDGDTLAIWPPIAGG
jgi:sulfur carrier protein ThiS